MNKNDIDRLNQFFGIHKQKFEREYSRLCMYTRTFSELMQKIMREQAVVDIDGELVIIDDKKKFEVITGLNRSTYRRIGIDKYIPSLSTFITLCMIYDLDLALASTLRASLGRSFCMTNRLHYAYCYLLVNCRGKSLSYCNKVLQTLGIEEKDFLGDKMIDIYAVLNEIADDEDNEIG